jgi:hypothetical protein
MQIRDLGKEKQECLRFISSLRKFIGVELSPSLTNQIYISMEEFLVKQETTFLYQKSLLDENLDG